VKANQADYRITMMCRVLGVSPSGYHAWRQRPPSRRSRRDAELTEKIKTFHALSKGRYGSPNIHEDLKEAGIRVGRKRVARLMRQAGLRGVCRRKRYRTTTPGQEPVSLDLVQRTFQATGPNQLWVADITYVPTWSGFLFLAVVMDVWSRRIVGWSMANHLRTELVLDALEMAIQRRQPSDVIHHSDQGCQYTSYAFGKRCRQAGIRPSMGSVGDCYDNAMCESFFATLETELIDRSKFKNRSDPRRRHSALGRRSPVRFERENAEARIAS
jgi:putative transposase